MRDPSPANRPFSADVQMALYVNGSALPMAQLGPNFLILRSPIDHPPTDAEIWLSIDGRERRWWVRLPDGISATQEHTAIARCEPVNGATHDL